MNDYNKSKREFLKKAAYVAPFIITTNAVPMIAAAGSVRTRCCNDNSRYQHRRHRRRTWEL